MMMMMSHHRAFVAGWWSTDAKAGGGKKVVARKTRRGGSDERCGRAVRGTIIGSVRRRVVSKANDGGKSFLSTDNPIQGVRASLSAFRGRDGILSCRKSAFVFGAKRELSLSVTRSTKGGRRRGYGVVTFAVNHRNDSFGCSTNLEKRKRKRASTTTTTTSKTSMKDGEETHDDDGDDGDDDDNNDNDVNVISKKIVSEDDGDEDFDLDVAFNEKNSDSKSKSDGERPLPQGTIRVKAKSSSNSPSSLGGKKEKRSSKEQRGSRDNLAFDPLAGSVDVSMDDFSYNPEQEQQMLLQKQKENEERERVKKAAVEEEANNKKKTKATEGTVIRRVSKVAAMPLRNKTVPSSQPFAINAANEEALRAVKQKFSLKKFVNKKKDSKQNNATDSRATLVRVGTVVRKISKPASK